MFSAQLDFYKNNIVNASISQIIRPKNPFQNIKGGQAFPLEVFFNVKNRKENEFVVGEEKT